MSEILEAPTVPTNITTLPPAERAALVLNSTKTEADLKQLAESLKAITLVNSPAGREQAHALAMTARTARTTIEKAGKAARDDATKFSKAVIAEEDRLIEIIQPEETRVLGLRNAWDAAEAARKEAEARAERERIERHHAVINQIMSYPGLARECRTAAMALQILEKLTAIDISGLEEFKESAHNAKIAADELINDIIEAKQTAEAEQARIKAEQEAEAARLAAERERLEAERAEAARVQAEQQAELLAQQARMKAQQEELDRQAAAMAKQAAELAERKAEAERPAEVPTAKLAEDPREALVQIMATHENGAPMFSTTTFKDNGQPIMLDANGKRSVFCDLDDDLPDPVIVQVPATVDELPTPCAQDLAQTISDIREVPVTTAIRWLAERADEFKTLAESQK
jgi:hypothetical protein